jgi:hypothetical protein
VQTVRNKGRNAQRLNASTTFKYRSSSDKNIMTDVEVMPLPYSRRLCFLFIVWLIAALMPALIWDADHFIFQAGCQLSSPPSSSNSLF